LTKKKKKRSSQERKKFTFHKDGAANGYITPKSLKKKLKDRDANVRVNPGQTPQGMERRIVNKRKKGERLLSLEREKKRTKRGK